MYSNVLYNVLYNVHRKFTNTMHEMDLSPANKGKKVNRKGPACAPFTWTSLKETMLFISLMQDNLSVGCLCVVGVQETNLPQRIQPAVCGVKLRSVP
jgi:hypothetical protein